MLAGALTGISVCFTICLLEAVWETTDRYTASVEKAINKTYHGCLSMSCIGESLICCLVWHVLMKSLTANIFESVRFILSPRPSVTRAAVLTPIVEDSP